MRHVRVFLKLVWNMFKILLSTFKKYFSRNLYNILNLFKKYFHPNMKNRLKHFKNIGGKHYFVCKQWFKNISTGMLILKIYQDHSFS